MKLSTLTFTVTLCALCLATRAPVAHEEDRPAGQNAAPLRATMRSGQPERDIAAPAAVRTQRWKHIALPKSQRLDRLFSGAGDEHLQT